jgi:1,4-dihydroxy-2-naphthoyl-CoA hydrolase
VTDLSEERVVATMPVHGPTKQPFGVLHGRASVVLAETVASLGTYNLIDQESQLAMGLEINANHIRAKSDVLVTAVGTPLHRGEEDHGLPEERHEDGAAGTTRSLRPGGE